MLTWKATAERSEVAETVVLDEDGTVRRCVHRPGTTHGPRVGWWRGSLDESVLATARELAASSWETTGPMSRPPAAGAWTVTGSSGRLGLWDPVVAPDLVPALNVVRSECTEAASSPRAVAEFSASWTDEAEPSLMLTVASAGEATIELDLTEDDATAPTAVFLTEEGEVLGFMGGELELPAGTRVHGVLRGRAIGPRGFEVMGRMATADEERVPFHAIAAVASS